MAEFGRIVRRTERSVILSLMKAAGESADEHGNDVRRTSRLNANKSKFEKEKSDQQRV